MCARLEARAMDLFNESIGRRDWTEMEIRIYDAYEHYSPHIERLRTVLRSLQIGLNLGGLGKGPRKDSHAHSGVQVADFDLCGT